LTTLFQLYELDVIFMHSIEFHCEKTRLYLFISFLFIFVAEIQLFVHVLELIFGHFEHNHAI